MIRLVLTLLGLLAVPTGVVLLRPVRVSGVLPPSLHPQTVSDTTTMAWDSLVLVLVTTDPFRPSRSPSPLAFAAQPVAVETPPMPPKPELVLTGIVWGAEPSAIIEGLPGSEGARMLKQGEAVGGIRLRRLTPDRAQLVGLDTTWTLTVRQPW